MEHEYARDGAWAYLAALDVHRAKVFGRCEATTGIAPFERLVDQVMSQPPYVSARRVFWVMDNGSSHRGQASVRHLTQAHPRLVPVHAPVHASWLNQIEIDFSIVQRKVLTPNDFPCLEAVALNGWRTSSATSRARASIRVEIHPHRSQCHDRAHA
ncbi:MULTISPECIES: transposase [unclassified Variovorax]|uniref:transposase n=1 Tax=unclassified Variovorax TaxID=663243 RepID=UPI003F517E48